MIKNKLPRIDSISQFSSSEAEVHGHIAHIDIQRSKGFYGFGENETVLHPFLGQLARALGTVTSFTGIYTSPSNAYLLTDVPRCKDCSGLMINGTTKPTFNVLGKCRAVHVMGNIESSK